MARFLDGLLEILGLLPKPEVKTYWMSGVKTGEELNAAGLEHPFGVLDSEYYITDLNGWKAILPHLLQDGYRPTFKDCENQAMRAMLDCSEKYGLNGIGLVIGYAGGHHAFNILYVKDHGFMLFEPQRSSTNKGEPFRIGEKGYTIRKVFI